MSANEGANLNRNRRSIFIASPSAAHGQCSASSRTALRAAAPFTTPATRRSSCVIAAPTASGAQDHGIRSLECLLEQRLVAVSSDAERIPTHVCAPAARPNGPQSRLDSTTRKKTSWPLAP
ncbi:hypothetical protein [Ruicaihuangia caeni]|uniref:hypothetical protein n=1 Tax=Ruicaihuangia caeni TaxID=3042517 RepID=UPI00338F21CC